MINCQEADVLAAAMSVGSLEPAEELSLTSHVAGCAACRDLLSEYMAAAGMLALAAEPMQPSPELRQRLMRAVYREAMAAERPQRPPLLTRLWNRIPTGRGFALVAGAAAGVIIGGSAAGGVFRSTSVARPSTLAVTLTGQGSAHGAHGSLNYNRDTHEATVVVTGLPQPSQVAAAGAVYELWLISATGAPVPGGFLSRAPNGNWTAALDTDVTAYRAVAATVEPAGGSQSPTGSEVIQGSIGTT